MVAASTILGWHEAISMRNLLITAEAVARAAYERKESRGAHTRIDFEGEREEFLQINHVISKGNDGNMQVKRVERTKPPEELYKIAHASIEDLETGKI